MSRSDRPRINKLLILEGLHGTGKSTLAASLATESRTATFHAGPPVSTDPFFEYLRPIVFLEGWNVVCDRWHLGEFVWPAIFGRPSLFPSVDGTIKSIEDAIQEAASVVEVWLMVGSGTRERISVSAAERCLERGMTAKQVTDAHDLFLRALEITRFDSKVVSWSDLPKEVARWKSLP